MNITSIQFAGFTICVLALYYLLPRRLQNVLLLAASLFFLGVFGIHICLVFVVLTLVNYFLSREVYPEKPFSRLALWTGISINLGSLVYFRYINFFVPYLIYYLKRIHISLDDGLLLWLFPIGLSFYIVQAISYLLDVYKKHINPSKNLCDFALYMLFFPRFISGPIERGKDLISQIQSKRMIDRAAIGCSFYQLLDGLIRKIAIADILLLMLPSRIFIAPGEFSAPELLFWLVTYAFLLYNDFAGYTHIVLGISGLFGIRLSENFRSPFFSRSISEFWQRWHITLSNWLRDYIFSPLTRAFLKKKKKASRVLAILIPPMITMLASGFWHGASFNMLVWGGLHGIYLLGDRLLVGMMKSQPVQLRPRWQQIAAMLLVFILTTLAWIPFRMEMPIAMDYCKQLLMIEGWFDASGWVVFTDIKIILSAGLMVVTLGIDAFFHKKSSDYLINLPPLFQAIIINAVVILVIVSLALQAEKPPPFIYQGF